MNLRSKKIIAIGAKTELKVLEAGYNVFYKPEKFNGAFLAEDLKEVIRTDEKVLFPQSEIGNDLIENVLSQAGIQIHRVPVYNVDIPEIEDVAEEIKKINEKEIDLFVFTSPSTFNNFLKLLKIQSPLQYFENKIVAAIGPTTRKHIESYGIKVQIEPEQSTFEKLIEHIIKYFEKSK